MTNNDIVQKLWNLCDVLRDDGINYSDYVTELVLLLFIKMVHENTEAELLDQHTLPAGCRWSDLNGKSGINLLNDYRRILLSLSTGKDGEGKLPDILLVDGGKGQMAMAREVLQELAVPELILLGVAKGVTRKPGLETLYLNDAEHEFTLPADSPALHLIQQIRDEAHRFAITGHRARRGKARRTSSLEEVAGVGPKRRRELLKHFGGLQELNRASIDEIAKAPGISKKLAESIYAALHSE